MEGHHFGKKSDTQRETNISPALRVAPAVESSPSLRDSPKEVGGFRIPENLKNFLKKLVDPNAIPVVISDIDRGDGEYRRKVEQYVEEISKDIHEKIDARSITESSREEAAASIRDCVDGVVQFKGMNLMAREKADVLRIIESDLLGLGPLDELLADDNISDIMVDGPDSVFIEMDGQIDRTNVRFRNELHLLNICQRIVNRVGRHVDKASPICDARLADGSRKIVNISEISGVEDGMVTLQDLVSYEVSGVDASGRLVGEFTFSGIYPKFREKARHYGLEADLLEIIDGV